MTKKLIGKLKSYKELMGMADDVGKDGALLFKTEEDIFTFVQHMKRLCGKEIEITKETQRYDFANETFFFKKEWFEWIKEEVDWSKVPVDTKCLVWKNGSEYRKWKRYFAYYKEGKPYFWSDGTTSWSANSFPSKWDNYEIYKEEK